MPEDIAGLTLQHDDERLDLLVSVLKTDLAPAELTDLRFALLAQDGALEGVILAALRRQILGNVVDHLEAKGLLHPARSGGGDKSSPRAQLAAMRQALDARRQTLKSALLEIVGALNAAGIEPLILKGSVSLLTGEPAWRQQRDIDLAVPPMLARQADAVLRQIGFGDMPEKTVSRTHHHLRPLTKPGLPAPVEIHTRLSGRRSARLLPDRLLLQACVPASFGDMKVRMLRADHFLLFGLVHHHFQNLGTVFGTISLKGLLEFAEARRSLSPEAVEDLQATLRGRPRLAGAFDLWTAANAVILGAPLPQERVPQAFAMARAAAIGERLRRGQVASRRQALREDVDGSLEALSRSPSHLATPAVRTALWLRPLLESLTSRSRKHGDAKARKVSGVVCAP